MKAKRIMNTQGLEKLYDFLKLNTEEETLEQTPEIIRACEVLGCVCIFSKVVGSYVMLEFNKSDFDEVLYEKSNDFTVPVSSSILLRRFLLAYKYGQR